MAEVKVYDAKGAAIGAGAVVVSAVVRRQLNRVPEATLVFADGSVPAQEFALSSLATLAPGAEVVIKVRDTSVSEVEAQVFKGLVVRHAIELRDRSSSLRVELKGASIRLTAPRKTVVHREQTDTQVFNTLIGAAAGLSVGEVAETPLTHVELIQYEASDWDFMLMRADVLGLVVRANDGVISFVAMGTPPKEQTRQALAYTDEGEIFAIDLKIDGGDQLVEIGSVAWDVAGKDTSAAALTPAFANPWLGSHDDPVEVATTLGHDTYVLSTPMPVPADELQAWAKARMARSRLSMIHGKITITGTATLGLLDEVELSGIATRFDGVATISGVIQRVDSQGWQTELELGLSSKWFARTPEIADVPATGLLPPVSGLQLGVVAGFVEDEAGGEHRVKVTLPTVDTSQGPVWARVAWPDAGADHGAVFWPSLDDQVVVGFFNDDPRQAVILGSLFSSTLAPPAAVGPPSADNFLKAIITKAGTTITFDDERPAVFVQTAVDGKVNKIEIDAAAETIAIVDQHSNSIHMSSEGVKITSAAKLELVARGDVLIKGASVDLGPN